MTRKRSSTTSRRGIFDPKDFQIFSADDQMVIGVYRDGIDLRHVTVRNFEPGQGNPLHVHPENAHCIYILQGNGEELRTDGPPIPITAGQIWIVPRGTARDPEHRVHSTLVSRRERRPGA